MSILQTQNVSRIEICRYNCCQYCTIQKSFFSIPYFYIKLLYCIIGVAKRFNNTSILPTHRHRPVTNGGHWSRNQDWRVCWRRRRAATWRSGPPSTPSPWPAPPPPSRRPPAPAPSPEDCSPVLLAMLEATPAQRWTSSPRTLNNVPRSLLHNSMDPRRTTPGSWLTPSISWT